MKQYLNMSAPWYVMQKKLAAFFELDSSVSVGDVTPIDGAEPGNYAVTVSVSNFAKADALDKTLRKTYEFGNIKLRVNVDGVAYDNMPKETPEETLKNAFAHNRLIRGVVKEDGNGFERTFVVVEPDVLQFRADNLADYRRNISMLAADVAAELFDFDGDDGTVFCTADLRENA